MVLFFFTFLGKWRVFTYLFSWNILIFENFLQTIPKKKFDKFIRKIIFMNFSRKNFLKFIYKKGFSNSFTKEEIFLLFYWKQDLHV